MIDGPTTIKMLQGGTKVLPPGQYAYSGTPIPLQAGVTYDFTNATFVAQTPGTMFQLQGDGITVLGGTYDSVWPRTKPKGQNAKVNVQVLNIDHSSFTWVNPTVKNVDGAIKLMPNTWGITIVNPHATPDIRGDFLYMGGGDETLPRGGFSMLGGLLEDSEQEHGVRNSTPGFTGGQFVGVTFRATNGKEPVALRHAHDITFINCTWDSNMGVYAGNNPAETPGAECHDIKYVGGKLIGGGYFMLEGNTHDITIDGTTVDIRDDLLVPPNEPVAISCSMGVRRVTFKNMTRYLFAGKSTKPWYRNFTTPPMPDNQVIIDGGNNMTVKGPRPGA